MVERISSKNVAGGGQKIRIAGTTPAPLSQNVSRSGFSVGQIFAPVIEELQGEEKRKAARQGIVDGQNGKLDPKLLFNPSLNGAAYTKAGITNYKTVLDLETRAQIRGIVAENPRNSANAKVFIDKYVAGKLESMPEELRQRIGPQYQLMAEVASTPLIARINANENTIRLQEAQVNNEVLDNEMAKDIPLIGSGMGADDEETRASSILSYQQMRGQIEGRYESRMGDIGADDLIFDPADKQNAIASMDAIASDSMIREQFRSMNGNQKAQYLKDFRAGNLEETFKVFDDEGGLIADLRPGPKARKAHDTFMRNVIKGEAAEKTKQENAIRTAVNAYASSIKNRVPRNDEQRTELRQKTNQLGTEAQRERLENLENFSDQFDEMQNQTPLEIGEQYAELSAEIDKAEEEGEIVTPGMVERLEMVGSLKKEKQTALDSDPLAAGIKYGDITPTGRLDSEDKMLKQAEDARTVSDKYGTPIKFLNADNLRRFNAIWEDPEITGEKVENLLRIFEGFGPDKMSAISELVPDNPGLAHLGALMDLGETTATANAAKGMALIRRGDKTFSESLKGPDVVAIDGKLLSNAYRFFPGTASAVKEVAKAIFTTMATNKGAGRDDSENKRLYEIALRRATGEKGEGDNRTGGLIEHNDQMLIVPPGINQQTFKENIEDNFTAKDFANGGTNGGPIKPRADGLTEEFDLKEVMDDEDAVLIPMGEGQYGVGVPDENGNIELYKGRTDIGSDNPAVQNGIYVLDYHKAERAQEERILESQRPKPEFKSEGEIISSSVQKAGTAIGDFGDSIFEKGKAFLKGSPVESPTLTGEITRKTKGETLGDLVERKLAQGLTATESAIAHGLTATEATIAQGLRTAEATIAHGLTAAEKGLKESFDGLLEIFPDAVNKLDSVVKFGSRAGLEISKLARDGIEKASGEIQAGVKTIEEFARENTKETKELAKLTSKKVRKLTNGESVKTFVSAVSSMIVSPANAEGLPPVANIMTAIVAIESSFKQNQVSSKGAKGPAQMMRPAATDVINSGKFGWTVDEILNDPEKNIMGGTHYLFEILLPKYKGPDRLKFAVAAYNAGPGRMQKARDKTPHKNDFSSVVEHLPEETQGYVKKFLKELKANK